MQSILFGVLAGTVLCLVIKYYCTWTVPAGTSFFNRQGKEFMRFPYRSTLFGWRPWRVAEENQVVYFGMPVQGCAEINLGTEDSEHGVIIRIFFSVPTDPYIRHGILSKAKVVPPSIAEQCELMRQHIQVPIEVVCARFHTDHFPALKPLIGSGIPIDHQTVLSTLAGVAQQHLPADVMWCLNAISIRRR